MTLTLRTNAYNDSLGECFFRHSLEHAQMSRASRAGSPRPLCLAIALIVGLMVFGGAHRTKAEELGHRLHHDNDYRLIGSSRGPTFPAVGTMTAHR